MRNLFTSFNEGTRRVHWPATTGLVLFAYAGTIAAAEVFWRLFTGGYSTLVGLYAFFTATLIVVRLIGSIFADPFVRTETDFRSS